MNEQPNPFLIDEYKECNNNLRHYSNMRFAQLSLFIIISGILFNGAFHDSFSTERTKDFFPVIGIALSLLFYFMQERRLNMWNSIYTRLKDIEAELCLKQHTKRPQKKGGVPSRLSTNLVYALFAASWLVSYILR